MNKYTLILIIIVALLAIIVYKSKSTNESEAPLYSKISGQEAKAMMDDGDVIILDVREESEYSSGHIDKALLLPLGNISKGIESITSDKDALILVYCRSGNRSKQGADKLIELGYTNVFDFGGINTWEYEIIK